VPALPDTHLAPVTDAGMSSRPPPPSRPPARSSVPSVPSLRTCLVYGGETQWEQVGEGTFGEVFKAKELDTGDVVALKKIRMRNEKEGFPITAIREIKLLRDLDQENIIKLKEVVSSREEDVGRKGDVYIVFEFMEHDLMGLQDTAKCDFTLPMIKCFAKQLLTGLHFCHKRNIMHRDIKGANLLISKQGVLKLGDFGLSRSFVSGDANYKYTNRVVTLWYRAPELLLGATNYGPEIDNWSAGCIIAELLMKKAIFPGRDEREQIDKVFSICGSPTEARWPGVTSLPLYHSLSEQQRDPTKYPDRLSQHLTRYRLGSNAASLLSSLLNINPQTRMKAHEALDHDWFWEDPLPCEPERLSDYNYASSHEYVTKKRKKANQLARPNHSNAAGNPDGPDKRPRR